MELFLLMQPDHAWLNNRLWTKQEFDAADAIAEQFTIFAKNGLNFFFSFFESL